MSTRYSLIPLLFLLLPAYKAFSLEGQELLDAQKAKLEAIGVDMNQSGKNLYDTFTNSPQKVAESGCLDQIRGIGVDAIVIDPMNLLGAVYAALKDEIMNQACSAATDFANALNEELNAKLELPYGIASIEIDGVGSVTGDGGVFKPDVQLDNEKVAQDVTKTVLESARGGNYSSRTGLIKNSTKQILKNELKKDTSDVEKQLENVIDIDKIWGGEKKDKDKGNNG